MVLSMERWRGKTALVTGAGGGVGSAVVEQLIKENLTVIAVNFRADLLEALTQRHQLQKSQLHTYVADIRKEEEVVGLFQWIEEKFGTIHILVNTAGVIRYSLLSDGEVSKWRDMLETNVLGTAAVTKEAVQVMTKNGVDGHIVHIGSTGGHIAIKIPGTTMYSLSKKVILGMTEALREELIAKGSKIKVTTVSPGKINTQFIQNANIKFGDNVDAALETMIDLEVEDVADAVLYALSTPPYVQVQELWIRPIGEKF